MSDNGFSQYYDFSDESSLEDGWNKNEGLSHAVRLYTDRDNVIVDDVLLPEKSGQLNKEIVKYSDLLNIVQNQTQIVETGEGLEKVELDLSDRVISLLLDQSGSQTWNDNDGLRHGIAKRLVNRISSTYPGDVTYNVASFGGKPVNVSLFAILETEELNSNDANLVIESFFQDESTRFAGLRVVRKVDSYPESPIDGDIVAEGFFK